MKILIFYLVLFVTFVHFSQARSAVALKGIGNRFEAVTEPCDTDEDVITESNVVTKETDGSGLDIANKLDHLTTLVGKVLLKMDIFEHRMGSAEASIIDIKSQLANQVAPIAPSVVPRVRRQSDPGTLEPNETDLIKLIEDKFMKTFERMSRIELTMDNVESQIHVLRSDPVVSSNCISKKFLTQLFNETKAVLRDVAQKEALSTFQKIVPEDVNKPLHQQYAIIHFHIRSIYLQILNMSDTLNRIHYETTEGKVEEIDQNIQKVRELYNDLVDELMMKNNEKMGHIVPQSEPQVTLSKPWPLITNPLAKPQFFADKLKPLISPMATFLNSRPKTDQTSEQF